jgi:asparagine N-glycosylation enzyme membrane subunit Stt3
VARCDDCGRPLCLSCALPVRGRVLGPECLAAAIGPDPSIPEVPERDPGSSARAAAGVAFCLAALATVLPWSRFGPGSEPFGAWSGSPTWSMLAAAAAVAGLLLWVGRRFASDSPARWDVFLALAGTLVALASVLAILRPPPFTSPWLGPWVSLVAGVAGATASIAARGRVRERQSAHI